MKRFFDLKFFKRPSPELSYFLGFYMADGHMTKRLDCISFGLSYKDIEILQFFKKILNSTHNIGIREQYNKKYKKYYKRCRLDIGSKELVRILNKDFKIPQKKTGNEIIPKIAKFFMWDFIRGVFDGDGSITSNGGGLTFNICSASKSFLEKIMKFIGCGSINPKKPIWNYRIGTEHIIKIKDLIYNKECFTLKRKKDKIINFDYLNMNFRRFTNEEIDFIKRNKNLPNKTLSKDLNRTEKSIRRAKSVYNATTKHVDIFTRKEQDYILYNFIIDKPRESTENIAIYLNRTFSSIEHKITRMKLRGKNHNFTEEQIEFIKLNKDKKPVWLAKELNISVTKIYNKLSHLKNSK